MQDLESAHAGHLHIKENGGHGVRRDILEGFLARGGHGHGVASAFEAP